MKQVNTSRDLHNPKRSEFKDDEVGLSSGSVVDRRQEGEQRIEDDDES